MPEISTALSAPQNRPGLEGKTVLVVDDDPIIRDYVGLRCRQIGLRVETAGDGLRAILKVSRERPDLLILDLNLPDVDGFRVVERLGDPKFQPVPVIILTGSSDNDSKRRCEDLHVYYVHKNQETWANLEPLICELLRKPAEVVVQPKSEAAAPRVLLVDDDPQRLTMLAHGLHKYNVEIIQCSGVTEGFLQTLRTRPDAVIADYNIGNGSSQYLLSRIKTSPSTQHIPVIIYSSKPLEKGHEYAAQRDIRGRGQAAAFLPSGVTPASLADELRKHITFPS